MRETEFFRELHRKNKKTILDSIIINNVTEDNIIESINNRYVKIFKFIDINFCLQEMNKKREILDQYKRILNVIDTNVGLSIILRNRRIDLSKNILFDVDDIVGANQTTVVVKEKIVGANPKIVEAKLASPKQDGNVRSSGEDCEPTNKTFVDLKKAVNETMKNNLDRDNNTFVVDKYFVFEIEAKNLNSARTNFEMLEHMFNSEIEQLEGAKLYELKRDNIYKFLSIFYNKNERDKNSNFKKLMNEETRKKLGISVKELIRPTNFIINDKEMLVSDKLYRNFYFYNNYKIVDVSALNNIIHNDFEVITCIKIRKLQLQDAIREVELELGNADGEIYRLEMELSKQGLSKDLLPRNAVQRKEEAVYINDSLKRRDENLFDVSMYMMIMEDDMRLLQERTYKLIKKCAINGLNIKIADKMQENVFNSILPNGVNQTPYAKTFDTESLCAFNIFYAADCILKDGDYYGVNKLTNNPVMYDIMSGDNYNSLILGMSGKGKGYKAKETVLYRVLSGKNRSTIIIDNENEYGKLTTALGGENIEITGGGNSHINLFDIDLSYGDNSISDKEDFILSVCSEMLHKPITSGQRTTISHAVGLIYEKWSRTNDKNDIPTIEDFVEALRQIIGVSNIGKYFVGANQATVGAKEKTVGAKLASPIQDSSVVVGANQTIVGVKLCEPNLNQNNYYQNSYEDIEILKAVEYYSDKSHCTLFRGKSNIDFSNKLITFNLSKLGKDLKTLAMQVICDTIWLKICKNRDLGIPTDLIIDEFHLMFKSEETASWMAKYWKMLRKYKGCPVGITQNPEDLLSSEDGRKVVANTNMNILLSMLEKDREIIGNTLNLTNEELKYIRNKKAGEGILVIGAGKVLNNQITIPFVNRYEKNNLIYSLINTSGDEEP